MEVAGNNGSANGHANGHIIPQPSGGHGGITSPARHARSYSIAIMEAMDEAEARRVPLGAETIRAMQDVIATLLADPRPRYRLAGQRAAQRALEYNLRRFEVADKAARLDAGDPTDRTEHTGRVDHEHALKRVLADPEALAVASRLQRERLESAGGDGAPTGG